MTIKKCTIHYSFLYDDKVYTDADVNGMSVDEIVEECNTGDMIGNFDELKIEDLKPEDVQKELLEMGNDGTFFDTEGDEDEDESEDADEDE